MYNFADVEAKIASPITIREIVKNVLRTDDGACYSEIEAYLMPPGRTGSRQFDQAHAVMRLLEHDDMATPDDQLGAIAKIMKATPTLRERALWDILQSVLRSSGFKMRHGRLTGLLEHKVDPKTGEVVSSNGDEDGQPDID